jgi:hypothetical protein
MARISSTSWRRLGLTLLFIGVLLLTLFSLLDFGPDMVQKPGDQPGPAEWLSSLKGRLLDG